MSEEVKEPKLFDPDQVSEEVVKKAKSSKKAKLSDAGEAELIEHVTAIRKAKLEESNGKLKSFLEELDKEGISLSTVQFWRDGMPGPLQVECVFKQASR